MPKPQNIIIHQTEIPEEQRTRTKSHDNIMILSRKIMDNKIQEPINIKFQEMSEKEPVK
jgi:hypothetical protein